ncbi:L,D-transpeptidase ErfK/SrfK [Ectothiorhodospira magna]|uniref:L,D-transpeptidase ErfK/SrfK n=1 Tax=Ectothiorhodospira magna TaxID=867345 RepID=A0A1H9BV51_9GAMM|nr:L,D-transpeptidase family protein [Ectothiorhodospira magna]SEP92790.1 L,D-transpeptidase ErfK/SrfK [Ectothiorhodospira magna]
MPSKLRYILGLLGIGAWSLSAGLGATTLPLQPASDLVGALRHVEARYEDTLIDIARSHQVGFEAIRNANPHLNTWIPGAGSKVLLPLQFVLPDAPRRDIIINLPEMRLYYFTSDGQQVLTYPVSIGRMDWNTPLGTLRITEKRENPTWTPPQSVRESYAAQGKTLPAVVPAGPDNPLGAFAMRLSRPSYLIHGTNWATGIGLRATHGCIRMDNDDIRTLYGHVSLGTAVRIINQPFKVGWQGDTLYLEAHPPLEEFRADHSLTPAVERVMAVVGETPAQVDWAQVRKVAQAATGVPSPIGHRREPSIATESTDASPAP